MNMIKKYTGRSLWLAGLMLTALVAGCSGGGSSSTDTTVTGDAPTVVETAPADAATNVATNSIVTATFSEDMDESTITTESFTVVGLNEDPLTGTAIYDAESKTASFDSDREFTTSEVYTATITTAVKSATGTPLVEDYVWTFTTGTTSDDAAPEVVSTIPASDAVDVVLNRNVSAEFNEKLLKSSVTSETFTLTTSGSPVAGDVSYEKNVATFSPTADLIKNTLYTATLTTGITDQAGNALATDYDWNFTTGETIALEPVNLKTAENFAIMSGTGITSASKDATITGNIGTSGITGASITVVCTELPGYEMFTDDATPVNTCLSDDNTAASIALGDVGTAYTEAAAAPAGEGEFLNLGAGTLTAQTLVPGVYTWGSAVNITDNITLDGGAEDVWIFQISGKLALATTKEIILVNGAQAKNVFWQVADVVTLETASKFKGIVLAKTDVAMIDRSEIEGRLLAQAEVRLGTTTVVTQPAL